MTDANAASSNPFINKLPPLLNRVELGKNLRHFPPHPNRALSAAKRLEGTADLLKCYFPTNDQIRFAQDFDTLLRKSYERRNVLLRRQRIARLSGGLGSVFGVDCELNEFVNDADASALNAVLLGVPQMGKSLTISRTLRRYSQCVAHEGMSHQVVWLRVDCPPEKTLKGFCLSFFDALDLALGPSNYRATFGDNTASTETMAANVLRLANIHSLGVVIFDNVQHLERPQSGDHEILKMLTTLSSVAGVPSIKVGTFAASEMLSSSAHHAFRNVGLASSYWAPIPYGRHWEHFFRKLWDYQWTLDSTKLTEELIYTFYDCTQGVISLAINLYRQVQAELIQPNCIKKPGEMYEPEQITPALVQSVYNRFFVFCHEHVDALRSKDPRILSRYPDLRPPPSRLGAFGPKPRKPHQAFEEQTNESQPDPENPDPSDDNKEDEILTNVAIKMAGEVSIDAAEAKEWINSIKYLFEEENLGRISKNPREFFKRMEKRIRVHLNTKKYTPVRVKPTCEPEDLRNLFDGKTPAAEILARSGFTGTNSIFGRR